MKRLWIAAAILARPVLRHSAQQLVSPGLHAGTHRPAGTGGSLAEAGDWERADLLTRSAFEHWSSRDGYLHVTLRHSDTDLIHVGFQEVLEFIECQEGGEYSAANARLAAQIQLIYESEQLTLKNVFCSRAGRRRRRLRPLFGPFHGPGKVHKGFAVRPIRLTEKRHFLAGK